tara:strand:+ start:6147 stop:7211 length:1065 start_codon:yes stop_codon:yes gene_type:complete
MKKKAIIVTDGLLHTEYAKTSHGLIRGSNRFEVLGIIDSKHAGLDAGEILDGKHRGIPIVASIDEAITKFISIDYLIVGVATKGGILSKTILSTIKHAITYKIHIVNGLHDLLCKEEDIVKIAAKNEVELIDIRKPKSIKDLHFWTGEIFNIDIPIIAVLGMDCAMGKRTTTQLMIEACNKVDIHAEMIYTGQTGWMQGSKFGFIFDSTINDFVSGELEHSIISCCYDTKPDMIFLEGQSSLRNPSGPCGLEMLISGNAKHVVLVHAPNRKYFDNNSEWGNIPSLESEIEIIEKFGSKVIAIALNTNGFSFEQAKFTKSELKNLLNLPVVLPIEEGVQEIITVLKSLKNENKRN